MKLIELTQCQDLTPLSEVHTDLRITQITGDSREVEPGALFIAIDGTQVNGADFLPEAIKKGAVAAIIGENANEEANPRSDSYSHTYSIPLFTTERPRQILSKLLAGQVARQPESIVAVTGTNGKSSTVSFTRQL